MTIEVQGHRIAGRLAAENSLPAISVASQLGIASVEFDVRKTKDGVLVVSHGPECDELPEGIIVEEMTYDDLMKIPLPGTVDQFTPLFDDVVKGCVKGGLRMNVEIKPGHADSVPEVLQRLTDLGAKGHFVISSFDRAVLRKVFETDPNIGVGALYCYSEPIPEDFATWWDTVDRPKNCLDSVNLSQETATKIDIGNAKQAGKKVLLWFSGVPYKGPEYDDSEDRLSDLLDLGVDCICTNRPDVLKTLADSPRSSSLDSSTEE